MLRIGLLLSKTHKELLGLIRDHAGFLDALHLLLAESGRVPNGVTDAGEVFDGADCLAQMAVHFGEAGVHQIALT
ncbi:MAG TPA: hypothetical protein VFJ18_12210 [Pararhizobium sp.]|nr:hypothetical protein [Pararhizobium sp.]